MNNKLFWITFALLAVANVRSYSTEEVLDKVKSKHIRQYLHERKDTLDYALSTLERHFPGISDKLKDALIVKFGECSDTIDDSLTMCDAIHSYTENCTAPLIKVVDDSLPQQTKGLASLGVKSVLSVSEFLCKQNGESIFELFNPCMWEGLYIAGEKREQPSECALKIDQKINQYKYSKHTLPSPAEMCSTLTYARSCFQTYTEKYCKNPKTRTSVLGLYDAIVTPCSTINEV